MIHLYLYPQALLLVRQMHANATPAAAAKMSLSAISVQAIMDGYLCMLHLTAGAQI